MKEKLKRIKIAGFLAFAVFFCGFGVITSAQETERPRAVETPVPRISPTPKPTPLLVVSSPPIAAPLQTVSDLQARVRQILSRPELRRGQVGVKIVSLESSKTIFEENAEKYFMPASNMKSFTIAAALEKLSPDFRFVTSVYAPAMPDASGLIRGDLTIYGRGDVSLSAAFNDGDYYKGLDALAAKIAQSGIKKIEGNLIGDESYFSGSAIPSGWEWDDLQWYYGAEISALPVVDNSIDLSVKPSSAAGAPCVVEVLPLNPVVRVVNRCRTTTAGGGRYLQVEKKLDQNTLEITGTMPTGDKEFKSSIAVSRPAELFLALLRQLLIQKGVVITGQNRVINAKDKAAAAVASTSAPIEIAKLESPPFSVIAAKTMKPSQNLYTETILRALGEQMKTLSAKQNAAPTNASASAILPPDNPFANPKADSSERGLFAVQNFLREIGVAPDGVLQYDGSGLSRHDLITPASAVQLYTYMARSRNANVWRDALPIAGVDGTLKNRFLRTAAAANARGKTGTIDQVSALSGYVTAASGERLVFSIIVNGVAEGKIRQAIIDEIIVALANFNGRNGQ